MWIDMIPFLIGILAFCVLSAAVYLFVLVRPRGRNCDKKLLCDYAHRGLHGEGVPENSLSAFARAAEAGYGIELDVQLSRDGTVMVFHDYTLGETVKSILMTIIMILIIVFVCLLIFSLVQQVASFVTSVFQELAYRV